ncbi:VOC family protein [Neobacillus niacini]|uniref:VOC family protein n=1 Tax=Neobacillus niacini TaxID=86668 RepID=UPI003982E5E2
MKIQKVGQIAVPVKDLDRAVLFYKEKLELPHLFSSNGLAFFNCSGLRLLLSVPENEELTQASSIIYFQVEDIHAAYEELVNKEITFLDEPHLIAKMGQTETWMAFFKDSEDNTHALMSEFDV